jgi:hypothetical protein
MTGMYLIYDITRYGIWHKPFLCSSCSDFHPCAADSCVPQLQPPKPQKCFEKEMSIAGNLSRSVNTDGHQTERRCQVQSAHWFEAPGNWYTKGTDMSFGQPATHLSAQQLLPWKQTASSHCCSLQLHKTNTKSGITYARYTLDWYMKYPFICKIYRKHWSGIYDII